MPKAHKKIGKVTRTSEQKLNQDFIKRFSSAILSPNESSMLYSALGSLGDYKSVFDEIGVDCDRALHTRERFKVFSSPPLEGSMSIQTRIKDLFEQQAGDKPMAFIDVEVSGSHEDKAVFVLNRIYAVSGGFPRS